MTAGAKTADAAPDRLLIDALPGEWRLAWLEDEELVELRVDRAGSGPAAGDLYAGRVAGLDKGLGAAFVELGLPQPGFLPLSEAPEGGLAEGDRLLARVIRAPAGAKGARLTGRLKGLSPSLAAELEEQMAHKGKPRRLRAGGDPLADILSRRPTEVLVDSLEAFLALKQGLLRHDPELAEALSHHRGRVPLFEAAGLEARIEALLEPEVALPSGGRLKIEPVSSMVAVDVDSGRHAGGSPGRLARAVNLEAAGALPGQLRLRGLSGLIVIDFLELARVEARKEVVATLRRGLKGDPEPARVQPMAPSGLVEMSRRRARPALHEVLTEPCGIGGSGRRKSKLTFAFEALRACRRVAAERPAGSPVIVAGPGILQILEEGPAKAARRALEEALGRKLLLRPEAGLEDYGVIFDE